MAQSTGDSYGASTKKPTTPTWQQLAQRFTPGQAQPAPQPKPTTQSGFGTVNNWRGQFADAQRYQQQGRSQLDSLYAQWRANQSASQTYGPLTSNTDPKNMAPLADYAAQDKAAAAYAGRMNAQAGGGPRNPWEIFGVHYGPNWRRSDYVPDPSLRMGELASIQMTPEEYIRRRTVQERMFTPGFADWERRAWYTPGQPHDIFSDWRKRNPRPGGFFQTEQERILRQNAAPTGQTYVPFGSSYIDQARQASQNVTSGGGFGGPGNNNGRGWGNGGGGWGGWGGGGGGGGSYAQQPSNYWQQFLNWRILEVQGG